MGDSWMKHQPKSMPIPSTMGSKMKTHRVASISSKSSTCTKKKINPLTKISIPSLVHLIKISPAKSTLNLWLISWSTSKAGHREWSKKSPKFQSKDSIYSTSLIRIQKYQIAARIRERLIKSQQVPPQWFPNPNQLTTRASRPHLLSTQAGRNMKITTPTARSSSIIRNCAWECARKMNS